MSEPGAVRSRATRLVRMTGRDPGENHRTATPLELLFDLAFVVAFAQAGDQLAHGVAEGHVPAAVLGFVFGILATCWAWVNYAWFASAYDTDDWFFRIVTMVQIVGVVVFALGMPAFGNTIEAPYVDSAVAVAGYVVMRVAMVAHWLRAAIEDPERRRTALSYAFFVGTGQLGWVAITLLHLPTAIFLTIAAGILLYEFTGPYFSERKTRGTPWHPHHIAERYGLLAIIALGEGIFGTVAAVGVLVEVQGWSAEAIIVVIAGLGLTFGLWWSYFILPSGDFLKKFRRRALGWGYGHILIYGGIAGMGAGLHVAALVLDGHSEVGVLGAVTTVCVAVFAFFVGIFGVYGYLVRDYDPFHVWLFSGSTALLVIAIALAGSGAPLGLCLLVATLSPAVLVVGYETVGHRHQAVITARVLGES